MALEKNITYHNGTVATYHKITGIRLRTSEEPYKCSIEVSSYTDKDYREQHVHNTVNVSVYRVDMTADEVGVYPIISLAYGKLKGMDPFKGANDV